LKQALAAHLQITAFDFQLCVVGADAPAVDSQLVSSCKVQDESPSQGSKLSISLVRSILSLERFEEKSLQEWRDMASMLQNQSIDDETALLHLQVFLNMYPGLVNWQSTLQPYSTELFRPLLSFAVDSTPLELRRQCVDELLHRGARISIRHRHGFLLDRAKRSNSGFIEYLKQKEKACKKHETHALAAWRVVSSKLCGETSQPVQDEAEMSGILNEFCKHYPEMVNFQNNHAVDGTTDEPYGYFDYSPLMTFAGAQACRRRRGNRADAADTRKSSVVALLKHGARVDVHHGGKTSLEWMKAEGSLLIEWLEEQLAGPIPQHEPFNFKLSDDTPFGPTSRTRPRNPRGCCIA